ncbi:MAG: 30S ribosomal protein S12 methylthiotransferase RimO, partial [Eggerthellaceae bacterium]|nr:30S ribosomal protein S12 methylthiotransferase RimO [Eggerthellaceae bacterium]
MGCAKNEVDSDHMALRLRNAGYLIGDDPEQADVVVVNTCCFIQAATEES